ncbi:MAG: serine/threonine protein kinase [Planctomycetes bacterium]|nr:serine/threonine protein kinase [Planctomycetota bacterium]
MNNPTSEEPAQEPEASGGFPSGTEKADSSSSSSVNPTRVLSATEVTELPVTPFVKKKRDRKKETWGAEGLPPPTLRDFRLLQKVGEGAMGAVFKAHQISTDRTVAVKVLFPHRVKNPRTLKRFHKEARILRGLNHPNVVAGYAVSEDQGWHYLVMEYIDGFSLQKWIDRLGQFPVGDALHIALACAEALRHAHDQGLVHRDIKPDNILITRTGQVKVGDFGMVKILDEGNSLTQTGHGVGTPCYMPLEQMRNAKETDPRSDIYALGCTLYCMLVGRSPFEAPTILELVKAKELAMFPPARRSRADVPERLDLIIRKMVAKDVRLRYQSCAEVIQDLRNLNLANATLSFLASAPPGARSPRPGEVPSPGAKDTAPVAAQKTAAPEDKKPADWWFLRYRTPEGKKVVRRLTTPQIRKLIQEENFDLRAKASRTLEGTYANLAAIREFKDSLLGRATRTGVDKQTMRNRPLFKKLQEADLQRRQEREALVQQEDAQGWHQYFWLGKLAAVGLAAFFLIFFLFHAIKVLVTL